MYGEVRLSDGANNLEGRLEVCINNAWGTVCPLEFTSVEAAIVCGNLGLNNGKYRIHAQSKSVRLCVCRNTCGHAGSC